ncbi:bifunctional adenosylcobinamide kinase/adenosylcobinamide-phosphate guanylyltransferase, partial [Pseudomonas aeruginosa]
TAQAGAGEMGRRIAEHRARRPAHWRTLEEPLALAATLRSEAEPGFVADQDDPSRQRAETFQQCLALAVE